MSWQEAILKRFHFNSLLAAIGIVSLFVWITKGKEFYEIIALIIFVYFIVLFMIYLYNKHQHSIIKQKKEEQESEYLQQRAELDRQAIKIWYASTDTMLRNELCKLITFDMVDNNPYLRVCNQERGQHFHYIQFRFEMPGRDIYNSKLAVKQMINSYGHEVYFINPYLYELLISQ